MSDVAADPGQPPSGGLAEHGLIGFVWMTGGVGVQAMLQFAVTAAFARLLVPEEIGVAATAAAIVGFGTIIAGAGVSAAVTQRPTIVDRHITTAFTTMLVASAAVTLAVVSLAPFVAEFMAMPDLGPVLRGCAPVFVLQGAAGVAYALALRRLRFRVVALCELVSYAVGFGVVGVVLAWRDAGVWAIVAALVVQAAVRLILLWAVERHPVRLRIDRAALRDLVGYSSGLTLGLVGGYVAMNIDDLVVARYLDATNVGIYSRAYVLMAFPAALFGRVLEVVVFPLLAQVQSDRPRLGAAYLRGVSLTAVLAMPASVFVVIFAEEIVAVVLGPQWTATVLPLRVIAIAIIFTMSHKLSDALAKSTGAVFSRAWRIWGYAVAVLAGSLVGQGWGVEGVAVAVSTAALADAIVMTQLACRETGLGWGAVARPYIRGVALTAVAAALSLATKSATDALDAPVVVALASGVLVAACGAALLWRVVPNLFGPDLQWAVGSVHCRIRQQIPRRVPV